MSTIRVEWAEKTTGYPMWKSQNVPLKHSKNNHPYFKVPQLFGDNRVCVISELRTGADVRCSEGTKWAKVGRVINGGRGVFIGEGKTFMESNQAP
jgi:hypothetical protein